MDSVQRRALKSHAIQDRRAEMRISAGRSRAATCAEQAVETCLVGFCGLIRIAQATGCTPSGLGLESALTGFPVVTGGERWLPAAMFRCRVVRTRSRGRGRVRRGSLAAVNVKVAWPA
ncbi:MAG: hypothetical protein VB858_12105 [Planctomycetaceae bacterium]